MRPTLAVFLKVRIMFDISHGRQHASGSLDTASTLGANVIARFFLGLMAWRQRRELARLDDSRLFDLGIRRAEAAAEARRPIWDVPQHWLRK
jgi:uncharacterized protein YjiS (DUF1127 family)